MPPLALDPGSRPAAAFAAAQRAARPQPLLRLAPGAHLLKLAGRRVLFSQAAEIVFELHGDALRVAELLAVGASAAKLIEVLEARGWPSNDARSITQDLLGDWSRRDLLVMDAPHIDGATLSFDVAGFRFAIAGAEPLVSFDPRQLFRSAEGKAKGTSPTFALSKLLGRTVIRSPSGAIVIARRDEAAPELKSAVIAELLRTSRHIALHAACLVSKGRAILLTGRPGAGKSTLAAALCQSGFVYAGDDITLLNDGEAVGVSVALTLKQGARRLLSEGYDVERLPFRRRDGVRLAYAWPDRIARSGSFPIAGIIHLDRRGRGAASLRPRDQLVTMRDLLAEAYSAKRTASVGELRMLDRIVGGARSFELRYSGLADGTRLICDEFL